MAYSTSNPPVLLVNSGGESPQHWAYKSSDALTTVDNANYFTNGEALGMKLYDLVTVITTSGTAASRTHSLRIVKAISSGAVSLSTQATA
jgi:hypothetical protein